MYVFEARTRRTGEYADKWTRRHTTEGRRRQDNDRDPIEIRAIVPNRVTGDNEDRRVLEALEDGQLVRYLPVFARSSHLDRMSSPGPGLHERIAFRRADRDGVSLAAHDDTVDVLDRLDALAALADGAVEAGENEDA